MIQSPYSYLETPSLLIDNDRALANIQMMQQKADALGLKLRPHIKTHRMPYFAKLQMEAGACGIACAKIGEAEVMADHGIGDIFIANEVIGEDKYERLKRLHRRVHVRIGIDNEVQLAQMEKVFATEARPLEIQIEYEVGEVRTGVTNDEQLKRLVAAIQACRHVVLKGIFSHEGHTYKAASIADCCEKAQIAYAKTVRAAEIIRGMGVELDTVSVGATPSVMHMQSFPGITELRLGRIFSLTWGSPTPSAILAAARRRCWRRSSQSRRATAWCWTRARRRSSRRTARPASAPQRASARSRARKILPSTRFLMSTAC